MTIFWSFHHKQEATPFISILPFLHIFSSIYIFLFIILLTNRIIFFSKAVPFFRRDIFYQCSIKIVILLLNFSWNYPDFDYYTIFFSLQSFPSLFYQTRPVSIKKFYLFWIVSDETFHRYDPNIALILSRSSPFLLLQSYLYQKLH